MKTENSFYVKILLWAYERTASGVGFTEDELFDEFDTIKSSVEKRQLYLKLFRSGTNDNHPIIDHLINKQTDKGEVAYWCLSDKGMSSAIDYMDLKEARENSRSAKSIAFWSIGIAIVVGILQIIVAVFQLITDSN